MVVDPESRSESKAEVVAPALEVAAAAGTERARDAGYAVVVEMEVSVHHIAPDATGPPHFAQFVPGDS